MLTSDDISKNFPANQENKSWQREKMRYTNWQLRNVFYIAFVLFSCFAKALWKKETDGLPDCHFRSQSVSKTHCESVKTNIFFPVFMRLYVENNSFYTISIEGKFVHEIIRYIFFKISGPFSLGHPIHHLPYLRIWVENENEDMIRFKMTWSLTK